MSSLITYHFSNSSEIRVIDNQWFIASDVCKGLEISDAAQAVRAIEKQLHEAGIKGAFSKRIPVQTNGGMQNMVCVNETGLNLLIMQSRKKEAVLFKWWIASEVLPSIRKTGSYALTISCDQQKKLRQAVQAVVSQTGRSYSAVYRSLHNKFNISRYQDILAKDFNSALQYLGSMPDAPEVFNPNTDKQTLIKQDGRWLVIVKNNIVSHIQNIDGCNCVNAAAFRKLRMQTKQQAEYLLELAKRMRVIDGDCDFARLDVPIEELHPKFII